MPETTLLSQVIRFLLVTLCTVSSVAARVVWTGLKTPAVGLTKLVWKIAEDMNGSFKIKDLPYLFTAMVVPLQVGGLIWAIYGAFTTTSSHISLHIIAFVFVSAYALAVPVVLGTLTAGVFCLIREGWKVLRDRLHELDAVCGDRSAAAISLVLEVAWAAGVGMYGLLFKVNGNLVAEIIADPATAQLNYGFWSRGLDDSNKVIASRLAMFWTVSHPMVILAAGVTAFNLMDDGVFTSALVSVFVMILASFGYALPSTMIVFVVATWMSGHLPSLVIGVWTTVQRIFVSQWQSCSKKI